MISDRHKTNNLVTLFCCLCCCLLVGQANGNGTTTSTAATATSSTVITTKTNANQDEVNGLALTPDVTTAPRLDPNNNNEWRPLGHGDPLQKDPTYDYSPPALERVRYWAENNGSGQSNPEARKKELPPEVLRNKTKSEILLLGVASERERATRTGQHQHQHQSKYPPIRRSYYAPQQQQQYMPHTHLMPPPPMAMMMKGMEYRTGSASPSPYHISMSHISSSSKQPMSSTSTATHHYYSSPSTSNWMTPHRMTYSPDAYNQESMQHFSYSRPQTNSVSYSPNSLQTHHSKPVSSVHRKPWLHELLQKELVKPKVKPTMPATKYLMGTTKPFTMAYTPVSFVPGPPTIAGPTVVSPSENQVSSEFRPVMLSTMITATPTTTTTTTTTSTTPMPIYQRPTTVPNSMATASYTGYTGTRLLIPQTSNLAQRPTVATAFDSDAASQTTDSLFSHYKQPQKAVLGPAYLIIEGHSKVKTYGQNELDPHSPKIVPVISKREPVVRRADPNEPKRGTVETFEVKHLHTKTTPMAMMTTTTTTKKPRNLQKPPTTSAASTTTPSPATLTTTTAATTTVGGVHDLLSLLDNMFADAHEIVSPNAFPASGSPTMSTILKPVSSSTKLLPQQPEPRIKSQAANSIFSLDDEDDQDDDDDDDNDKRSKIISSTEQPLRATRQVFDYDQLPESRIKDKKDGLTAAVDYMDELEEAEEMGEADLDTDSLLEDGQDDEADEEADNDENEDGQQAEDSEHNLLKRIDQFVDDVDDGDDDLDDLIENLDDEQDEDEDEEAEETLERRHHQH
ncbi:uncharacterized protein Dwil_GK18238 [Drosophila willistoni]|uniref:Mucin-5AC n=1 Tax=Drosophila willistoni TaxID=7260 RepID=B4MYX8_DROWI|nr:uncharacterized protein Dwil_GK18238 [Drosophila willistoni]